MSKTVRLEGRRRLVSCHWLLTLEVYFIHYALKRHWVAVLVTSGLWFLVYSI